MLFYALSLEEFDKLKLIVEKIKDNPEDKSIEEATEKYLEFLQNTAPWIQDELINELRNIKYDIEYISIINNYNKTKDSEELLESLSSFIDNSSLYEDLDNVKLFFNEIIDESNKNYDENIANLVNNMKACYKPEITFEELQTVYNQIEPYIEDASISKELPVFKEYFDEVSSKQEIMVVLRNIDECLQGDIDSFLINDLMNQLSIDLSGVYKKIISFKLISIDDIKYLYSSCLNSISEKNENYAIDLEKQEELETYNDILVKIESLLKTVDEIDSSSYASSNLSICSAELVSLKYYKDTLTKIDTSSLDIKIADLQKKIDKKEIDIQKGLMNIDQERIKEYNKKALESIKLTQQDGSGFGINNDKRITLLLTLQQWNTSYLYEPIQLLYNEVFQGIYNKLKDEYKIRFAVTSLEVTKIGIYD